MRGKNSFVGEFSEIKQILSINVLSDKYIRRRQLNFSFTRVKESERKRAQGTQRVEEISMENNSMFEL